MHDGLRPALYLLLLLISGSGMAQVFRCGEPTGTAMWSMDDHKVAPDG
jgi:hypothetical protein